MLSLPIPSLAFTPMFADTCAKVSALNEKRGLLKFTMGAQLIAGGAPNVLAPASTLSDPPADSFAPALMLAPMLPSIAAVTGTGPAIPLADTDLENEQLTPTLALAFTPASTVKWT